MFGLWMAVALAAQVGGEPLVSQPVLSAAAQLAVARRAMAACSAKGAHVAVAIAAPDGVVRTLVSDDAATRVAVETARRKAVSAVLVGYPTSGLTKAAVEAPAYVEMLRSVEPALVTIGGGVPIRVRGVLVAAIGVGGAAGPDADEACAATAIGEALGDAAR